MIVLFSHQIFAQTNFNALYLQTYRQAIDFYNNQEYGKALKYAEDSIVYKKDLIQSEVNLLVNSLAPKEVSSVGEKIDNVLKILTEREDKDAIDIINKYLKLKGYDFFQDSISNLLDYIKGNIDFPEADKLIGDVYKIDTEYEFAKYYYEKALKKSEILNIPNEKYEILYMLADIEALESLAEAFGVDIEELIYGEKKEVIISQEKTTEKNRIKVILAIIGSLLVASGLALVFFGFWQSFSIHFSIWSHRNFINSHKDCRHHITR